MDSYQKYQLKKVINASGKMTILGVSKVADSTQEIMNFAASHFFEMADLSIKTGQFIANLLGVEAATIVSSASAGIAQSIAGIIGQGNLYHLYHPYDVNFGKREIILPKGHNVDYGTPVELMINQGGGKVVEAGYSNVCTMEHIEQLITDKTAGILYVKSHHTVQKSMLTVRAAAEVASRHKLPLIVDAAAEEDLYNYVNSGADIVIYSGTKAIEGPTSGLVIGQARYIEWTRLQSKGLGRSMKIGKEGILGLTQSVENYLALGLESGNDMKKRLEPFILALNQLNHVEAQIVQDGAGRDIYRGEVKIGGDITAKSVVEKLKQNNPAIYVREYRVNQGVFEFDIRAVDADELKLIIQSLQKIMK